MRHFQSPPGDDGIAQRVVEQGGVEAEEWAVSTKCADIWGNLEVALQRLEQLHIEELHQAHLKLGAGLVRSRLLIVRRKRSWMWHESPSQIIQIVITPEARTSCFKWDMARVMR